MSLLHEFSIYDEFENAADEPQDRSCLQEIISMTIQEGPQMILDAAYNLNAHIQGRVNKCLQGLCFQAPTWQRPTIGFRVSSAWLCINVPKKVIGFVKLWSSS